MTAVHIDQVSDIRRGAVAPRAIDFPTSRIHLRRPFTILDARRVTLNPYSVRGLVAASRSRAPRPDGTNVSHLARADESASLRRERTRRGRAGSVRRGLERLQALASHCRLR